VLLCSGSLNEQTITRQISRPPFENMNFYCLRKVEPLFKLNICTSQCNTQLYIYSMFTCIWLTMVRCWIYDRVTWSWLVHWLELCRFRSQCRTFSEEILKTVLDWRATFKTIIALSYTFILCLPVYGWTWWGAGLLRSGWFIGWSSAGSGADTWPAVKRFGRLF